MDGITEENGSGLPAPAQARCEAEQRRTETERAVREMIDWYQKRSRLLKFGAKLCRWLAVVLVVAGGAQPLLEGAKLTALSTFGNWGYLCLAAAAAMLLIDKVLGFSSGWMRSIDTKMRLQQLLDLFQIRCAQVQCQGGGPESRLRMLELVEQFQGDFWREVQNETRIWMAEYRNSLALLERRTRTLADAARHGSLLVSVQEWESVEGQRLRVLLDGSEAGTAQQGQLLLPDLPPGTHRVRVEATRAGRPVSAEAAVVVTAGATASVALALVDK